MSDQLNEISSSSSSTQQSCLCYKKLQSYGVPLYINEENDYYTEGQGITYENAFSFPGYIEINDNITEYLIVDDNDLYCVFYHLTQVIPSLSDFEENVLSFWIMDMFIEGLRTAQNAKMQFDHQKATLLWIAYGFNYIQSEQKKLELLIQKVTRDLRFTLSLETTPSRKEFFVHLKEGLLNVGCQSDHSDSDERTGESLQKMSASINTQIEELGPHEEKNWKLPLPPGLDNKKKYSKISSSDYTDSTVTDVEETEKTTQSSGSDKNSGEDTSEINLSHMKIILEILYRIFGQLWVYLEIQTVFHGMPSVKQVDLPFELKHPKSLLKQEILIRGERGMRWQSFSDRSFEEVESERELHKNDYILPLQIAEESKLLLKQFFPSPGSQRSIIGRRKT